MGPVDPVQLTVQVRESLRACLGKSAAMSAAASNTNRLQGEVAQDRPLGDLGNQLEHAYQLLGQQTEDEIRKIDETVALLDALEALYQAPTREATPAKARPPLNKKRKTDSAASRAGSPTSSTAASPMPTYANAGSPPAPVAPALPRAQSAKPSPAAAVPQPLPIAPAPVAKKPTAKSRKDALLAQLPLRPGRTIAVKESKKATTSGPASDNYILGRIVQCLQGDKNRYSVEDVDYDPAHPTPEGGKWNTTLKSIIPLPEKGDERTYPDYDFPVGSFVLACYPETTSFYRATVESGPHTLTFGSGKKKGIQKTYRLTFDDDDGQLRDVPLELVCDPTPI
ncbi:hypothetical protein JCM10908_002651 [Rhodotorula pacifica]|uniref:uncharacterized protein n=1 Tax=Rhodotorula pacifica TaxID=1495444 RepID=UPI00316E6C28